MVSQAMRQRPQQLNQAQMKCVLIRGDVLYNSRSARSLSSLSIIYTCWSLIRSDCTHCTVGGNLSLPPRVWGVYYNSWCLVGRLAHSSLRIELREESGCFWSELTCNQPAAFTDTVCLLLQLQPVVMSDKVSYMQGRECWELVRLIVSINTLGTLIHHTQYLIVFF